MLRFGAKQVQPGCYLVTNLCLLPVQLLPLQVFIPTNILTKTKV